MIDITMSSKGDKGNLKPLKYQMRNDVQKMTRDALAKECRRFFDMANKRINRLESSKLLSPALHSVMKEGKFYAKGADFNALQHEYSRCINFLNMSTSTVGGARKHEKYIESLVGDLTPNKRATLFEAYRRLEQVSPAGISHYGSENLIQYLADEIKSEDDNIGIEHDDLERILEKAMSEVDRMYEIVEQQFNDTFKDTFSF